MNGAAILLFNILQHKIITLITVAYGTFQGQLPHNPYSISELSIKVLV
jgi:hypothetical protein